ncbi:hypothetical protein SOMG_04007 [Schizosaccharomyces osmophilus]|uniref:Uncharacterized protein n=1 Tax=Schizosaccharomyces osmophilus TaxID=2545709 RepID=A0AAE9WCK9_9SCHI|nr:uncharacterized protein SOMG_04007 [Schizosaccharomyces osmophilus]WBW73333.1 hypothetical protein SOMG_04007 [Schizosaccharomyces osmophilus]
MLLLSWINALLFAGTALASMPHDTQTDATDSYGTINENYSISNSPIIREKGKLSFFPLDGYPNMEGFFSCDLLYPIHGNKSEPAYTELYLLPNVNGTVHFRSIFYPDIFQAYKHAIDGSKDLEFLKSLVPKPGENFFDSSLDSDSDMKSSKILVHEPGMHCFIGYQEVPEDTESFLRTSKPKRKNGPIMHVHYRSSNYRSGDFLFSRRLYYLFLTLSVIYSCVGLYWLIRWLRNPRKITFTHCLLFTWYIAFLFNHIFKRSLMAYEEVYKTHGNFAYISLIFGYFFGDGIERSLFNSFILALALGMGFVRQSSYKLIALVTLVGWIQWAFITIAPFLFPVLFTVGSSKAKSLQVGWMLFNFGYIPSVMFIGQFLSCRKGLTPKRSEAKSVHFMVFIALTIFSILVSLLVHVKSAACFDYEFDLNGRITLGTIFFNTRSASFENREDMLQNNKLSNVEETLPSYKDDPETDLLVDEKLPLV